MLAICPNNNEVHIYSNCKDADSKKWKKEFVLAEHDLVVTSIDWSAATNKLVTCSQDRNAFVWSFDESQKKWTPSLVILRINRAALSVKWSPDGKKFAVASGAKCVPVCYYEDEPKWWISKMIKKHKSTVIDIAWHPNSQLLATGSSDFKCRVFSAFIEDTDSASGMDAGPFKQMKAFGECLEEYESAGWVESVAWSPSGTQLGYSGHDSAMNIVSYKDGASSLQCIKHRNLPTVSMAWLSEKAIVAGGHDQNPLLFNADANGVFSLDRFVDSKSAAKTVVKQASAMSSARSMFESKVSRAGADVVSKDSLWTKHEGAITGVQVVKGKTFSSCGLDGRIVLWDMDALKITVN